MDKMAKLCNLIPSIREGCLMGDDLTEINLIMKACFGYSYSKTLMLHEYSTLFNNELHGSLGSLHTNSSLVYVGKQYHRPGFVAKYLKITDMLHSNTTPSTNRAVALFVAAINSIHTKTGLELQLKYGKRPSTIQCHTHLFL